MSYQVLPQRSHFQGLGNLEESMAGKDDLYSLMFGDTYRQAITGAFTLANSLKTVYNNHVADVTAYHILADSTIGAAAATTLATLITLTTELLTKYAAHDVDAQLGVPTYHAATSLAAHTLTSAVAPTTLHECVTRLNDLKAKYNLHDVEILAHTTGSAYPEATASMTYITYEGWTKKYLPVFEVYRWSTSTYVLAIPGTDYTLDCSQDFGTWTLCNLLSAATTYEIRVHA